MVIPVHSTVVHTPPVDSATVMVLRDGSEGLEVLLIRRHGNSGVLGGVHVFPGGKLDAADRAVSAGSLDAAPESCLQALGEPSLDMETAVGLHAAALRETFEECGLLLGASVEPTHFVQLRERTRNGEAFADVLQAMGRTLTVSALSPWSRWVTPRIPSVANKRFDTRFFVAAAPASQRVEHCTVEATEAVWMAPRTALERYWTGEIDLAPPQIMSLYQLVRLHDVVQVLATARSRPPALIEPEPFDEGGARVICYPGDPAHSVSARIWAGPTRLTHRNQRFEPEGGLAALLG